MKASRRRLAFWLGVAAIVAALLLLHFQQIDNYRCQLCQSRRQVRQWRVGFWMGPSLPLSPRREIVEDSHFCQDFFGSTHVHNWKFAQGSPYYFFGTTWEGCALGGGRHTSQVFQLYECDADFRKFIQSGITNGTLNYSNTFSLIADGSVDQADALREAGQQLIDSYFRE
jgi:hypothetical protein